MKNKTEEKREKQEILLKLSLYFISLWILLIMLIILKIDIEHIPKSFSLNEFIVLLKYNLITVICVFLIVIGLIGYFSFKSMLNDAKRLPVEITKCESTNYENLSFLATYIIPLVCFPMNTSREIFVLFAVIIVTGCIFTRTNLYYSNPTLLLVGFNVYRVSTSAKSGFMEGIIIVQGKIQEGDHVKYFNLSDNVYFGRRITNAEK